MSVANMYDRLNAGETVKVSAPPLYPDKAAREFSIKSVSSEKYPFVHGYSIVLPSGEIEPSHNGMFMDQAEIDDWALQLDERDQEPAPHDADDLREYADHPDSAITMADLR